MVPLQHGIGLFLDYGVFSWILFRVTPCTLVAQHHWLCLSLLLITFRTWVAGQVTHFEFTYEKTLHFFMLYCSMGGPLLEMVLVDSLTASDMRIILMN
jgi:hypothetical protein